MTITEKAYAVLAAVAPLTALNPADRILPPGNWQNIARPYIIHFPVGLAPTITHEGHQPLQFWEVYQVSVFSDDYPTGEAVALLVKNNFRGVHDGVHVFERAGSPFYQGSRTVDERAVVQVHHFVLEFRIAEAL